jgi:hypothetical protein
VSQDRVTGYGTGITKIGFREGKKRVFVGYSGNSKAYSIYVPGQRQIEVSRDVTFHEKVAFKKSKEL